MADVMRDQRVLLAACLLHPLPVALATAIKEVLATAPQQQAEPVQSVVWVDERAISWLAGRRNKASAHVTTTLSAAKSLERPMALYTAPQQQAEPVQRLAAVEAERNALLEALAWIDRRCPADFLLQDLHKVHLEAAFDAGVCARAAIKAVEEGK